jgi:hypothetical protein
LQGTRTFNETSEHLGTLKGSGTLGEGFKVTNPVFYHKELGDAFASSRVEGKLFIPPLDIVNVCHDMRILPRSYYAALSEI